MSKKRSTRNTNKSLKALKRKKYAKGSSVLPPYKKYKDPYEDLYSDPAKNNGNDTPPAGGPNNDPDVGGGVPPDEELPSTQTEIIKEGITDEAPIGIEQQAPVATLTQNVEDTILKDGKAPAGTVTGSDDIKQLQEATDATSTTVTADSIKAEQGKASQAEVSGVKSEATQWAEKYVEQYPNWNKKQKAEAQAWAYGQKTGRKTPMPAWLMDSDFLKGLEVANATEYDTTSREAEKYKAEKADSLTDTIAAEGDVSKKPVAGGGQEAKATEADPTKRDDAAEEAALGTFADRPPEKDYATAAQTDDRYNII